MNATAPERLRIERMIRAPRQRVFDAFVNPELRRLWWFPEEGMSCDPCEIDARPGGRYRVGMRAERDGEVQSWVCNGEFLELAEPTRLVFSWVWEHEVGDGAPEDVASHVVVELHEVEGGTWVVILHDHFHEGQDPAGYEYGWQGCLTSLERALARDGAS